MIQLIGVAFAVAMLYFTHFYYRRKEFSKKDALFWVVIWAGFGVLIMAYQSVVSISGYFGVIRFLDLVTILSVMLLFALMFFVYDRMRIIQRKVERIVEAVALREERK